MTDLGLTPHLDFTWKVIATWWWLVPPFVLFKPFAYFWLFWKTEIWFNTIYKPVLIEIKFPKEITKSAKAMEAVLTSIHGAIYNPPDWWEANVEGQVQTSVSLEIASIDGQIHFFMRFHYEFKDMIEAAIYSQYPEAEILEVPDYAKQVPLDIPNKEWDIFGWDFKLDKPSQYPINTYEKYEKPGQKEEEKIDPLASLLEGLSKIKPGEQMWIQMRCSPQAEGAQMNFYKGGEEIRDKLARREVVKKTSKPILQEIFEFWMFGPQAPKEEKPQELIPVEMKLTPGERETIMEIERKISKPIFMCGIRVAYLGKKDVWFKPNFRLAINYFNNFSNPDLNSILLWSQTMSRFKKSRNLFLNFLVPRLTYLKCRKIYRCYKDRVNYKAPLFGGDKGRFILNVEELATLYHFPSYIVSPVPGLSRVEARKAVPPELPT